MDRLCIAIDVENVMTQVTVTGIKRDETLADAMLRVLVGEWEWSPKCMDQFGDSVECFLMEPEAWKQLKVIKWPKPGPDESIEMFQQIVNRCKIRTYKMFRMHWTHVRAMYYARRS